MAAKNNGKMDCNMIEVNTFLHCYKANSSSSKRSRMSLEHVETVIELLENDIDALLVHKSKASKHNIKRKMRQKMAKLSNLKNAIRSSSLPSKNDMERYPVITKNDMEQHPVIFNTWIDDPLLYRQLYDLKTVTIHEVSKALSIEDSVHGSKLMGRSKYKPVYILVPRDSWLKSHNPNPEIDAAALKEVLKDWGSRSKRGKKHDGIAKEYAYFGVTIPQADKGVTYRHPVKKSVLQHLSKMMKRMQFLANSWLPFGLITILEDVKSICQDNASFDMTDNGLKEIWSSMATSYNYISPAHIDKDAFLGCLTVTFVPAVKEENVNYGKYSEKEYPVALYFCFPEHGVAVALRPGDVMFFNPREYHCVSQRTNEYKDEQVFVTSFYLKAAQVSLNNNSIPCGNDFILENLFEKVVDENEEKSFIEDVDDEKCNSFDDVGSESDEDEWLDD
jgi:hypothetical protein